MVGRRGLFKGIRRKRDMQRRRGILGSVGGHEMVGHFFFKTWHTPFLLHTGINNFIFDLIL